MWSARQYQIGAASGMEQVRAIITNTEVQEALYDALEGYGINKSIQDIIITHTSVGSTLN